MMWMVRRGSVALMAAGLAVGWALVLAATPVLRTILFGVSVLDPSSHLTGIGLLCAAAIAASLPPAIRAARIDPAQSLRAE